MSTQDKNFWLAKSVIIGMLTMIFLGIFVFFPNIFLISFPIFICFFALVYYFRLKILSRIASIDMTDLER